MGNQGRRTTLLTCLLLTAGVGLISACGGPTGSSESEDRARTSSEKTPDQRPNRPPTAAFSVVADHPENGDPVNFDATATTDPNGDELTYSWRFGDGTAGGGEKTSHIFQEGGRFEVTLTVTDPDGASDSATRSVPIKDTPFLDGKAQVTVVVEGLEFEPLAGVEIAVVGSDRRQVTDKDGEVTFQKLPTERPLAFRARKEGYATQVARVLLPNNGRDAPVTVRMRQTGTSLQVDQIEQGASVEALQGARLEFPPNSLVGPDGRPVTGTITVELTTFDVSESPAIETFPGSFIGLRTNGASVPITSFGAMEVKLRQDGRRLQVRPGASVEMVMPTFAHGASLGGRVPLWSLDESTGLWVEEGTQKVIEHEQSPTDRALRAEVTHFTVWTGAYPVTTPCEMRPKCVIVDPRTANRPEPVFSGSAPLRAGKICEVTVTAEKVDGLGESCRTSEANVSGHQCTEDGDCTACRDPNTPSSDIHGRNVGCTADTQCKSCGTDSRAPPGRGQPGNTSSVGDACNSKYSCSYGVEDGRHCNGSKWDDTCSSRSDCKETCYRCNWDCSLLGCICKIESYPCYDPCEMTYRTEYGTCRTRRCDLPRGMACNTDTLPGGQNQPSPGGTCKIDRECNDVQYCDASGYGRATGQCSFPDRRYDGRPDSNQGPFAGPTGGFQQTFYVDAKGHVVDDRYHPPEGANQNQSYPYPNPERSNQNNQSLGQGYTWVPNTHLRLQGRALGPNDKGLLHGATTVVGEDRADQHHFNQPDEGRAQQCKETEPVIPLRHRCKDGIAGLTGRCPTLRQKRFCNLVFKCQRSEYAKSLAHSLGLANKQDCINKFANDFDIPLLKEAIKEGRAYYDGDKAARCLDSVAALVHAWRRADREDDEELRKKKKRQVCSEFDAVAMEMTACTGVVGKVPKGQSCTNDLECKNRQDPDGNIIPRVCDRSGSNACAGTCTESVALNRACGSGNNREICGYNEYCQNGSCYEHRKENERCNAADQCRAGLYCDLTSGRCKEVSYKDDGENCTRDQACHINLWCDTRSESDSVCQQFTEGECIKESGGGTAGCRWNQYCGRSNGKCDYTRAEANQISDPSYDEPSSCNWVCKPKLGHRQECTADYECLSGVCQKKDPNAKTGHCFGPTAGTTPQVYFMLDESGSMGSSNKWSQATSAIKSVVQSLSDKLNFGLGTFESFANNHVVPSENSQSDIDRALQRAGPGGGTNIARAVDTSIETLDESPASNTKVTILITDGKTPNAKESIRKACKHRDDIGPFYAIGLKSGTDVDFNNAIAAAGGARQRGKDKKAACCRNTSSSNCTRQSGDYVDLCQMNNSELAGVSAGRDLNCNGGRQVANGKELERTLDEIVQKVSCGKNSGGGGSGGSGTETCNGKDDDGDGYVDENLTRSCGKSTGACTKGIQRCYNGSWGSCQGNTGPSQEGNPVTCGDGIDNDCDGKTDCQDSACRASRCGGPCYFCTNGVCRKDPSC